MGTLNGPAAIIAGELVLGSLRPPLGSVPHHAWQERRGADFVHYPTNLLPVKIVSTSFESSVSKLPGGTILYTKLLLIYKKFMSSMKRVVVGPRIP